MSDTDESGREDRVRIELHLPPDLVARLHEQFPEARDVNSKAALMALGHGLFARESGRRS